MFIEIEWGGLCQFLEQYPEAPPANNISLITNELEVDVHETVDLAWTAKLTKTYQKVNVCNDKRQKLIQKLVQKRHHVCLFIMSVLYLSVYQNTPLLLETNYQISHIQWN